MLEYVLKPGTESCRDEEHFLLELAIHRDARQDKEFLPYDLYDDATVLVRITLEKTPDGKFRGLIEHLPPAGQPAAPPVVKVNSECADLVKDVAFAATAYLPFLKRPECVQVNEAPAPPPPAPPPAPPAPAPAEPSPRTPACDPDKDGDPANDERCKRLLSRLGTKYGARVEFSLLGGGLMTLVYTAGPGPGVVVGASVGAKHWSVALEAQATLPAYATTGFPGQDFDVSSFVGLVVPCARFGEMVRFVGCGVVGAGVLLTWDAQAPTYKDTVGATIRLGPRLGLEVPFGHRFAFFAFGEVAFAPILARVTYGGNPDWVWEQSPASVFLGAGFSVRLGD